MTFLIAATGLFTVALAFTPAASADTTVTVSTTVDEAQAGDGTCSLREATLYANGTAEPDCAPGTASGITTITVPAGLYRLRGQVLTLTKTAALMGAGAGTTTVDAAGASQAFFVQDTANVAITGVTITGGVTGQITGGGTVFGLPGGGINNNGTLALNHVIVTGNHTSGGSTSTDCTNVTGGCQGGNGGDGGGIANNGTLTIANSAITANSTGAGASGTRGNNGSPAAPGSQGGPGGVSGTGGQGAGIVNFQTLTITNSTIAGNTTGAGAPGATGGSGTRNSIGGNGSSGGNGGFGGGIENSGRLVISGSTISGNETGAGGTGGTGGNGDNGATGGAGGPGGVGGEGGGIASTTDMTITNSTITDNSAAPSGMSGPGGLINGLTPGPVGGANGGGIEVFAMGTTLTHVTVAFNRAAGIGGGVNGDGGTITAGNSIIASNQATTSPNCDGVITDQGGNIEFGASSCPAGFLRADPRLGPLANNGGPTQTIALQPGSAAIHHVRTCVLSRDQRGAARPVGSACDSGAYEVAPPSLTGISAGGITTTSATVAAAVNPNLQDGSVVVNYGRTQSYGSSTPPLDVGAGNASAPFTAALTGLAPGTTYHYDVVATNADGRSTSSDHVFTTLPPLSASIARATTTGSALSVTIACAGGSGPGRCSGTIRLTARGVTKRPHAKKHRGKPQLVATRAYAVASGRRVTVKVRLNRAGQRLLNAHYVLSTTLSLRGTTRLTRAITFRYRKLTHKFTYEWSFPPGSTSGAATELTVGPLPRGGSVIAICHGGGCPFSVRRFAPRHGQVALAPIFGQHPLHPGATLQIEALAPNQVGEVDIFGIRPGQNVSVLRLCLPPGTTRPARCA